MRLIAESLIGFQINLGKELYRQAVYKLNVIKILPVNPNHEPAEMKEDERAGMKQACEWRVRFVVIRIGIGWIYDGKLNEPRKDGMKVS